MDLLYVLLVTVLAVFILVGLIKIYLAHVTGWCRSKVDLAGKTACVTGANTGIGFYTAMDLARRNARVILACRDVQRGQAAVDRIIAASGNTNVVLRELDLSRLKSVREFVKVVMEEEARLDILVNNAGVVGVAKELTEDGLEKVMATNHFGPFLLTNLLLVLLKRSAPSRVVNVSSVAHSWTQGIDFDNLQSERCYDMRNIYRSSKLANILFTKELAQRLTGSGVTTYSLHPGYVETDVWRNVSVLYWLLIAVPRFLFFKSAEAGAQTSIYCSISEDLEGISGRYYVDCQEADCSAPAEDMGVAKKLWEVSETLTGLA